ncbi:MAG: type 2 isopentenyl-diphosphate Delta-isomerase [Thaumarchaeota archaeon]|nr:type 2 isopentenyl-diphosphate Delta-isomerase [Nitrososphaerota archaeon]
MLPLTSGIEKRKADHIEIATKEQVNTIRSSGFNDVQLVHLALPDINRADVDLSIDLFGKKMRAPIIIESMTGGTDIAEKINGILATGAENNGLAMGVGSQRAAIEKPELQYTYKVVRKNAPNALIFANIGCPQLIGGYGLKEIKTAIEMIEADAIYIHLNALQESVQVEGETDFLNVLDKIKDIAKGVGIPVLAKETGAGIGKEVAIALEKAGVSGIDVSGVGGTTWSGVEYYRAKEKNSRLQMRLGETFWDWGIPTVVCIVEVRASTNVKLIASGGIRNGLHVAKSLSLGADVAGFARPALEAAVKGIEQLEETLTQTIEELKTAVFLTGSKDLRELRDVPLVISGESLQWLTQRGFDIQHFAKRKSRAAG